MNNTEATDNAENDATRPRRSRQPKAERRVCIYRLIDGNAKEQGVFPEAVIGDPLERRLPTFLKEMFGAGEYKVDLRKTNGHFEKSFPILIAESEPEQERIVDVDLDEFEDEPEPEEHSFADNAGQMNTVEVENLILKERLRRLEEDAQRQKSGNQGETQALLSALEEGRRREHEMMLMMVTQAQKPQQDATLQAMSMLEKSFGMISKARDLSEQIAPGGSGEGSGGILADGAKMIDSLGRAAPTFLPILAGLMPKAPQAPVPTFRSEAPFAPVTNENGNGDLAGLAEKIQKKESAKK